MVKLTKTVHFCIPVCEKINTTHPSSNNLKKSLYVSEGKTSYGKKNYWDATLKRFQEFYKRMLVQNLSE